MSRNSNNDEDGGRFLFLVQLALFPVLFVLHLIGHMFFGLHPPSGQPPAWIKIVDDELEKLGADTEWSELRGSDIDAVGRFFRNAWRYIQLAVMWAILATVITGVVMLAFWAAKKDWSFSATTASACTLQADPAHPAFEICDQDGFRMEVPGELSDAEPSGLAVDFRGPEQGWLLHFETRKAAGAPADVLGPMFQRDSDDARGQHVAQANGDVFWAQQRTSVALTSGSGKGAYYAINWDDAQGTNHYRAVVAVPDGNGSKIAIFELDTPAAASYRCSHIIPYLIDTLKVSGDMRSGVRPAKCPQEN